MHMDTKVSFCRYELGFFGSYLVARGEKATMTMVF
jgi:hypothetical protein